MKHAGKAAQAARKLILWTFAALALTIAGGVLAIVLGLLIKALAVFLLCVWGIFAAFTFYFFRDPEPSVPSATDAIVSPAHGKVDLIDEMLESEVLGGPCRRVSIFLSVIDVHVQNAPIAGTVTLVKHTPGQFLNALNTESAIHNENVLVAFDSRERAGEKIGVRLIAGLIARRIVPFVEMNDAVERGERISLIQFGSRCDLYLPMSAKIQIKLGDHVKGGETIIALRG
ncbi:MAG: phosphatidylserine decarboxylase family protein [Verrucomicrobia bacterium]|nr:phosphatidylserine decarboxylase family protein [Verrucomicrobiota bacterium]